MNSREDCLMATLIMDPAMEGRLRAERAESGADRYDEVWRGTYMMAPMPNDEHQQIVMRLASIFQETIDWPGHGDVRPGVNVSDLQDDWTKNYRVPDVAVFLREGRARNFGEYWYGGPDFVVEVVSTDDKTRDKLPFYASVSVRELLIVDRNPWKLELYRLSDKQLNQGGASELPAGQTLNSAVLSFTFGLVAGNPRPRIQVRHTGGDGEWLV
jgi:Uma2 family endonuclease